MRDGAWVSGAVREVSAVVSGLAPAVTVESVSVSRELPSALPGQSIGGRSAATASVEGHVSLGPVSDRVGTPWTRRGWPRLGDRVRCSVTDGESTVRLFTGQVDGTSSSLGSPEISVPLVDDTDKLSTLVSHRPVFREHPPRRTNGSQFTRMTGMTNYYVTNLAAREAGFFNTPPMDGFCLVSVPLVGSTWPERGVLDLSFRHKDPPSWQRHNPTFLANGDTVYATDTYATYVRDEYETYWGGGITRERPLSITLGARASQGTSSFAGCRWITDTARREVRLAVTSDRDLLAVLVSQDGSGAESRRTIAHLPAARAGAWKHATLRLSRASDNVLGWEITSDTGYTATGQTDRALAGSIVLDQQWDDVCVYVPQTCFLNGVQVSYTTEAPASVLFRRSFVFRPDRDVRHLPVMPALVAEPASGLLERQAEVESAAVWIDEDGVLQWRGHDRMVSGPVVREFTSSEIADAEISLDGQDTRRKVTVKYTPFATKVSRRSTITVYEGGKDEFVAGDKSEVIINPPADEQWVQVDSTLREVWGDINWGTLNTGEGSFHGYTALRADGEEMSYTKGDGDMDWSFAPIGPQAWKFSFTLNRLPSGVDRIKMMTRSDDGAKIARSYRDRGLPWLQAMGMATSSEEAVSSDVVGPSWAQELEIDAGWLIQHPDEALARARDVADLLKTTRPRITGFKILPDPRLQLADRIRVREGARTGLVVEGIVSKIDQPVGPGSHEMSVELAVLSVTIGGVTWDEFDDWWDGATLREMEAAFAGELIHAFDADPLRDRGPVVYPPTWDQVSDRWGQGTVHRLDAAYKDESIHEFDADPLKE